MKLNFSRLAQISLLLLVLGAIPLTLFLSDRSSRIRQIHQANELLDRQQYSLAIAAYDRLLATELDKPHLLWINRGYAWTGLQKYRQMLQSCSKATEISPQAPFAWNCRGEALFHLQQYDAALAAFKRAIALNPRQPIFWLNQSQVLNKIQQHESAAVATEKTIELLSSSQPKDPITKSNLAIALTRQGQSLLKSRQGGTAFEAFQQALQYSANYLPALQGKAVALYRLGQYPEAIEIFDEILQREDLTPEQEENSLLYRAVSLCQIKDTTAARQSFQQVLRHTSEPQVKAIAEAGCGIQ